MCIRDRYYGVLYWMRPQIFDAEIIDDHGILRCLLSPDSVRELNECVRNIDFGEMKTLCDSLYENPNDWQNSNRIPNDTKRPLAITNWRFQDKLVEFDKYNRFSSSSAVLDVARVLVKHTEFATQHTHGMLITGS